MGSHRVLRQGITTAPADPQDCQSVKTYFNGGKLVIEREGIAISGGVAGRMVFHGSVGSFVMGDIVNGKPMGSSFSFTQACAVVGIALPEAPAIKIQGSGDVTLFDLQQAGLELEIAGSGKIKFR